MKESKPNFLIDGDGDHGSYMIPSAFFCISGFRPKLNKRIVLVKVERGTIAVGDPIVMYIPGKEERIVDVVDRIEIMKKSVTCATEGEFIGLKLKRTTTRQLREFNNG